MRYKIYYKNIGKICCPYFNNEPVFFNRKGFNHLLRSGNDFRSFSDQIDRLNLLKYCKHILSAKHNMIECRITKKGKTTAVFWGFKIYFENLEIKLIVRQINKGERHFFSIYKNTKHPVRGV